MKVYLETYGCTANKCDESIALGVLKKQNHEIVYDISDADVLVILTCTVIGTTEQRMVSRLKVFKNTDKKIIVAGCMPSVQKDLIKSIVPNAFLLPTSQIKFIDRIIDDPIFPNEINEDRIVTKYFKDISAPIPISSGCMFSCSYCITHIARGKLKSNSIKDVISDVKLALSNNCKEIFLTAQDTASYGMDNDYNLGDLLEKICEIKGDFRIRVGMMNPFTLQKNLDSILNAFNHRKVYKFIHLPVQSGDNKILESMRRKYTSEDFKSIISIFKKNFSNLTVSTDIIVGFPGETDKQFENSMNLIKEIKPDIVNITKFSARPKTIAKNMENRISTNIVKKRSIKLTKLCKNISRQNNKKHLENIYSILVIKKYKDFFVGRAENYKPVILKENVQIGDLIKVRIVDYDDIHLVGKLI